MKEFWSWLQVGFAALGGFTSWFFGHNDGLLTALVVFVIDNKLATCNAKLLYSVILMCFSQFFTVSNI